MDNGVLWAYRDRLDERGSAWINLGDSWDDWAWNKGGVLWGREGRVPSLELWSGATVSVTLVCAL